MLSKEKNRAGRNWQNMLEQRHHLTSKAILVLHAHLCYHPEERGKITSHHHHHPRQPLSEARGKREEGAGGLRAEIGLAG